MPGLLEQTLERSVLGIYSSKSAKRYLLPEFKETHYGADAGEIRAQYKQASRCKMFPGSEILIQGPWS